MFECPIKDKPIQAMCHLFHDFQASVTIEGRLAFTVFWGIQNAQSMLETKKHYLGVDGIQCPSLNICIVLEQRFENTKFCPRHFCNAGLYMCWPYV